jgi:hypothetical protein
MITHFYFDSGFSCTQPQGCEDAAGGWRIIVKNPAAMLRTSKVGLRLRKGGRTWTLSFCHEAICHERRGSPSKGSECPPHGTRSTVIWGSHRPELRGDRSDIGPISPDLSFDSISSITDFPFQTLKPRFSCN